MNYKYKFKYNVNYIKAMLVVESTMGFGKQNNNGNRDIMQCLDSENPALYCMAKIAPPKKCSVGYDANEGIYFGIPSYGFGLLRSLFNKKHVLQEKKITPQTSVCFGIFWLGYKTKLWGSIKSGIEAYNGGGNLMYYDEVVSCNKDVKKYLKRR